MSDPVDARVGTLTEHFSPLGSRKVQLDDFAIARLGPGVQWDARLKGTTRVVTGLSTQSTLGDFRRGDPYTHYGAETGPKTGLITHAEGAFKVDASGHSTHREWVMEGMIPYTAHAIRGDSGGAVLAEDGNDLVGLHTAGFRNRQLAFFYPIGRRVAQLGFRPAQTRTSPAG